MRFKNCNPLKVAAAVIARPLHSAPRLAALARALSQCQLDKPFLPSQVIRGRLVSIATKIAQLKVSGAVKLVFS